MPVKLIYLIQVEIVKVGSPRRRSQSPNLMPTTGEEYNKLADDARTLHYTIQDLEDLAASRKLDSSKEVELREHFQKCEALLQNLDLAIEKYDALPVQSQRTFDRMGWSQDVDLKTSISLLATFYKSLLESPQSKIESALEKLAEEYSSGRHDTASIGSLSTMSDSDDDDSGWLQIVRDLTDLGVPENILQAHRSFIIDWILRAINSGALTEKMPVEEKDDEKIAVISTPPPLPPKISNPSFSAPQFIPPSSPAPPLALASDSSQSQVQPQNYLGHSYNNSQNWQQTHHSYDNSPNLQPITSHEGYARPSSMDEPPSPIEPESDILWTAQKISEAWQRKDWAEAKQLLNQQIMAVERGEYVEISGEPVQPDLRILRHILGVCHSLSGDFLLAKEAFESVLHGVYVLGLSIDDGDIAACRWLGETCIYLNEPSNAALAWSIAFHGLINRSPPTHNLTFALLHDLRFLNQKTNGLNALRNSVVKSNRDISSILMRMRGTDKFQIVLTAIDNLSQNINLGGRRPLLSKDISLAEGFLFQPLLSSRSSWPFPQDPFFQSESSINLLSVLSRPKQEFQWYSVATTALGHSKTLTYSTKQPLKWLVEAVRFCLNTYAIEWKIQGSMYLLRLSQTHERIAYYDCFGIKLRKLQFRNTHGIKLTEGTLYTTRSFGAGQMLQSIGGDNSQETQRKEVVRNELADRLRGYLEQAERDTNAGNWPPVDAPESRAPYEMSGMAPNAYAELSGAPAGGAISELPGEASGSTHRWKRQSNFPIAELPG
ncbi:hypothetical protein EJ08DRAFT_695373 [Tothia fuscella]|uniref:Uncharacterized protein n=1 Tax=Tothia fuscella TaxID=1048955 RepID=A0A9P4TZK8_9PEZI|nr:hypothetical protein EJ08DRAFT_695373 [Tothia fuscella]